MKHLKTFVAYTEGRQAYICLAYAKKQMKAAGMNMKLDWFEEKDEATACRRIECDGFELKNSTNVSSFSY